MSGPRLSSEKIAATHAALQQCNGNVTQAAKLLKIPRGTFTSRLTDYPTPGSSPSCGGDILGASWPTREPATVPAQAGQTRVVLMTAAQDNTGLYDAALANLEAYAAYRGGELKVGGFTYQKGLFEDHMVHSGAFSQKIIPLIDANIVDLAPNLVWYGAANILPTAVDPLTGWETNTRSKWAVFPHAKVALKCVPTMPGRLGKQIMTTGVITKPNYVQRNSGQKAEFHHTPGATIAEIRPDGTFFLRQIGMTKDGSFQDLDYVVSDGVVTKNNSVESITWGDIHFEEMDHDVARVLWGFSTADKPSTIDSMLDDLRPKTQFFHDSFSFKARSHHTVKDPHERGLLREQGVDSVQSMFQDTARFLNATRRSWAKSIHVSSNHNRHLDGWLKDPQGHFDAANAKVWHEMNLAWFQAIEDGEGETFSAHIEGLKRYGAEDITFLHAGQSYLICQDTAPIECGLHGDIGPRGSRGSPTGLAKIVERVNTGHTHEPQIREAVYVAGTSSRLDLKYAIKGPGAWQHAEVVSYPNGKRTIVTLQNGRYRG